MKRMICLAILACLACLACEGKQGPIGPQGPAGPGTRIIYQSTTAIPNDDYTISVPEITLDDMPLVSVYVQPFGIGPWTELPYYFENYPDWGHMCFFTEGEITFLRCEDFYYKIVIVI